MAKNVLEGRQDAKENNCKLFRKLAEGNNIEKILRLHRAFRGKASATFSGIHKN